MNHHDHPLTLSPYAAATTKATPSPHVSAAVAAAVLTPIIGSSSSNWTGSYHHDNPVRSTGLCDNNHMIITAVNKTTATTTISIPSIQQHNLPSDNATTNTTTTLFMNSIIVPKIYPRYIQWRIDLGLISSSSSWDVMINNVDHQRQQFIKLIQKHPYPDDDDTNVDNNIQNLDHTTIIAISNTHKKQQQQQQQQQQQVTNQNFVDPLSAIVKQEQEEQDRLKVMDMEYRKQQIQYKRNPNNAQRHIIPESEDYDIRTVSLQMIDKDLKRLPCHHHNQHGKTHQQQHDDDDNDEQKKREDDNTTTTTNSDNHRIYRKLILQQVLYIWSCENINIGYLQGMHEIASYVLLALEYDNHITQQQSSHNTNDNDNNNNNDEEQLLHDVNLLIEHHHSSLTMTKDDLCADTYWITDCIIRTGLFASYDIDFPIISTANYYYEDHDKTTTTLPTSLSLLSSTNNTMAEASASTSTTTAGIKHSNHIKPLVAMSQRVISKLSIHDPQLARILISNSIPITLLLSKWVRVLFSREVIQLSSKKDIDENLNTNNSNIIEEEVEVENTVLSLWDRIFYTIYQENQDIRNNNDNTNRNYITLLNVVECMTAGRFILHSNMIRYYLMNGNDDTQQSSFNNQHCNSCNTDCLHYLMNIPNESNTNIQLWLHIMRTILTPSGQLSSELYQALPKAPVVVSSEQQPMTSSGFLSSSKPSPSSSTSTQFQFPFLSNNNHNSSYSSTQQHQHQQQENNNNEQQHSFLNKLSLFNIKDKITSQTQSIQKRIQHEWESFQQQQELQEQQRMQELQQQSLNNNNTSNSSSMYNLDYHRPIFNNNDNNNTPTALHYNNSNNIMTNQQFVSDGGGGVPTAIVMVSNDKTIRWTERLNNNVTTLQNYIIQLEQNDNNKHNKHQNHHNVSPSHYHHNNESSTTLKNHAWEALSDLQILMNEIKILSTSSMR